jgi:hypothetical protein
MRVHHLDFDQRSRDDHNLFVITPGISVMRSKDNWGGKAHDYETYRTE